MERETERRQRKTERNNMIERERGRERNHMTEREREQEREIVFGGVRRFD